ncbi:MAG: S8 family serine peptidase [Actinomycetota bacterium]|nr:S8 family serine peptidase [Actinomycetota bacterium]
MDTPSPAVRRPSAQVLLCLSLAGAAAVSSLPGTASAARSGSSMQTVVVTGAGDLSAAVRAAGGKVLDHLPLIGGLVAQLPQGASLPSAQVAPNRPVGVSGSGDSSGPASTVRATLGLGPAAHEGSGVTVAVVDTGVADVPDLAGRVSHVDVTGDGTGDGYGHGTFVAGLVAGDGSGSEGAYAGVAPAAKVLDVRVAHSDGTSDLVMVLKGLQVVANHPEVDVVNLSLSSGSPLPYQMDPLTIALESLWARGTTVVVPAGNDGAEGRGTVSSPGVDPVLLTVGGLDEQGTANRRDDEIASWSSQGPAPQGVQKPDLAAPGTHVVSTGAVGSQVWNANPDSRVGSGYLKGSGTSFSTAVTAGAVAALVAQRPGLSPDQVKSLLTGSAYKVHAAQWLAGSGGLDLDAALSARTPKSQENAEAFPGDPAVWQQLVDALLNADEDAAARQWALLSPEARQWAARQWAASSWAARQWAARQWAASSWADISWAARQWAARQWAASSWAARQWSARQWSDDEWAARQWSARQWSEDEWAARQWSARQWSEMDWTSRQWSARQWSARQWTAADWA